MIYNKPSNPIKTNLVESWTATASLEPQQETLSEVDEWLTKSSHWLGFSIRLEGCLDPHVVREGLKKTLYHIPALGARVTADQTDSKKLYQLALLQGPDQGVVLEYCKGTTSRKDIHLPDDSDTQKFWKEAGLEAPGPGYSGEASRKDPLFRARLIVFEQQQVSYLCIGINHGLCDGSGICDIIQTWSHFTNQRDASSLPDHLARRRVLGERVTTPHNPANSIEELNTRRERDLGKPYDPFSIWTFLFKLLPKAIWCMARQDEMEVRVSAARLAALKKAITQQLPEGEWVSTFEVLVAAIFLAEQVTSDSGFGGDHNLNVACNLRGRSQRFTKDYFGNAAFDYKEPMQLPRSSAWSLEAVSEMAREVHRAMRKGLTDAEKNACRAKDWYEAARHLGLKNKYDIWSPVVFDALEGTGTFVNSWDQRWLDCAMDGKKTSSMVAWIGTLQNILVNVPRHATSGDSTIFLALPPGHGKTFRAFCQEQGEALPFEILQ